MATQPGTTVPTTVPTDPTESETAPTQPPIPDGWHLDNGHRYYYINGQVLTGWQSVDGLDRYFLADGALANGWIELSGKCCYFDAEGTLVTGWLDLEDKRYYLEQDGARVTGWLELEEKQYYFREDGTMARGCVEIDGVKHYFTSAGAPILLVNVWNYMPQGYEPDLVTLDKFANYDNMYIDRVCYDDLVAMLRDCQNQAARAVVVSAYRTHEFQTMNYQRQVQKWLNKGYSQEEAERLAAQEVLIPGTSEHQLGLAVDLVDVNWPYLDDKQAQMTAQKWLMEHCWEYGFILRYPEGKTDVTGIIYEPWHYRYVGKELAKELTELGLTLEEYLDALTNGDL
jgi:LAS superfamily LD-carboxypeptidase LdcB